MSFPEDAARFTAALEELGFTQAGFCRFLMDHGDPRKLPALQRQIGRFSRGERSVSGEMWVLLEVLKRQKGARGNEKPPGGAGVLIATET